MKADVRKAEKEYFKKLTGQKVSTFGQEKLSLQSDNTIGVAACTSSPDSSQFIISTKAGSLLLFNSANLKLKAVGLYGNSSNDGADGNFSAYSKLDLYKTRGNMLVCQTSQGDDWAFYATQNLINDDEQQISPQARQYITEVFGSKVQALSVAEYVQLGRVTSREEADASSRVRASVVMNDSQVIIVTENCDLKSFTNRKGKGFKLREVKLQSRSQ